MDEPREQVEISNDIEAELSELAPNNVAIVRNIVELINELIESAIGDYHSRNCEEWNN